MTKLNIFECNLCPKRFKSKYGGLYPHIQSKHCGITYACKYCLTKISRWYNLLRHEKNCYKRKVLPYLPLVEKSYQTENMSDSECNHYQWFQLGRSVEKLHTEINEDLKNKDNRYEKLKELQEWAKNMELIFYYNKTCSFDDALKKFSEISWAYYEIQCPDVFCKNTDLLL